ncbi:hypothetical protein [Neorhizobium galegae]|uniref:hypothetical protein n=1 Tax=Neorhizobium galegae TaxID=399 RepID=UPI00127E9F0A|nr:hypothetical protein [Neorhizobium galegae]KAA9385713.1 hypothetical protein F4V88_04165 [Neorhizobium galegae]MCM2497347.1 hypothetical protein [Neorhizobium galegae]
MEIENITYVADTVESITLFVKEKCNMSAYMLAAFPPESLTYDGKFNRETAQNAVATLFFPKIVVKQGDLVRVWTSRRAELRTPEDDHCVYDFSFGRRALPKRTTFAAVKIDLGSLHGPAGLVKDGRFRADVLNPDGKTFKSLRD